MIRVSFLKTREFEGLRQGYCKACRDSGSSCLARRKGRHQDAVQTFGTAASSSRLSERRRLRDSLARSRVSRGPSSASLVRGLGRRVEGLGLPRRRRATQPEDWDRVEPGPRFRHGALSTCRTLQGSMEGVGSRPVPLLWQRYPCLAMPKTTLADIGTAAPREGQASQGQQTADVVGNGMGGEREGASNLRGPEAERGFDRRRIT